MASDGWFLDERRVSALRVDHAAVITAATAGLLDMLGVSFDALRGSDLASFCEDHLGGSVDIEALWQLTTDSDKDVAARLSGRDGRQHHVRIAIGQHDDDDARTMLFTDTTALATAQGNLDRRLANDRLLHLLTAELLDDAPNDPDRVINDVLRGFADYFGHITTTLTISDGGRPQIQAYLSHAGVGRDTFERLAAELHLLEAPDVDELIDPTGPGDCWRIDLNREDRYALGLDRPQITCVQVTVPFRGDEELSVLATFDETDTPGKDELDLLHNALSQIAQFLRRTRAEERIRRHGALDEALAGARVHLAGADATTLLDSLSLAAQRVAAITGSTSFGVQRLSAIDPHLRNSLPGWDSPRPVSPEHLGLARSVQGTWAVPVSDGQRPIAVLSYICADTATASDTAAAFGRLVDLVPTVAARPDADRRLEAAFQKAPVGIALRDADGLLIDCNEAFLSFVGAAAVTDLADTARVDLVDGAALSPAARRRLHAPTLERAELPFLHRQGHTVWGRVTSSLIDEPSGAVTLDHIEDISKKLVGRGGPEGEHPLDTLTGLLSRQEVETQIAQRIENGEPITITSIDLDHFSAINASLGHVAGDRLLQLVAERLTLTVGPDAELARAGGDEFIVVTSTAGQRLGLDLAERIMAAIRQPFTVADEELLIGASIGVCIARGAATPTELLLAASDALSEAKQAGRNRIVHYQSNGDRRRVGLFESELRRAITERSLDVYYQPEFDTETRLIVGAEALIRWRHPEEGLLAAGAFVPLAEEIGLSGELGDHVLRQACEAAVEWQATVAEAPFEIRVNLSNRDIEAPNIVERVIRVIEETGLPARSLCLEVTESAIMRDQRRVVRHLHQLRDLGVGLAIDDFGTGFSSLWILRELPFDTLKIDQAFIAALDSGDPVDYAIVETIVSLGHTLGMAIIAEGVETESQFDALRAIGILRAQGFLLSRPQPKADVAASIALSG